MSQNYRQPTLVWMSVISMLLLPAAISLAQITTLTLDSGPQPSDASSEWSDLGSEGECEDSDFCRRQPTIENSEFCRGMAELLRVALKNQDMDSSSCREAIETAMALVERNAQAEANTRLAEMKTEHEQEMATLRGRDLQMSAHLNTVDDLKNWLGPLYTNQNRTMQQIQMLAYNSNTINRTLSLLEKQLSSKSPSSKGSLSPLPPNDALRYIDQNKRDSDIDDLRRQVSELKKLIQPQVVRPANHLQPIYDAKYEKKQRDPRSKPWLRPMPQTTRHFD